jgi:putative restriction endonuclease
VTAIGSEEGSASRNATLGAAEAIWPLRLPSAENRVLLQAARAEGFGSGRLPDFLGLEYGGELVLFGQEELGICVLEASLREQLSSVLRFVVRGEQRLVSGPAGDWPHPAG